MASVTIQVLEGLERGRIYSNLPTPVTIGREDDNTLRLNDERVSRFHAKIQQDGEQVILTDLQSTNGTRVNGHPVQMRVLRPGDRLVIGRCLLLFGSPEEIAKHASDPALDSGATRAEIDDRTQTALEEDRLLEPDFAGEEGDLDAVGELFPSGPPELPADLRPAHRAQLSDLLAFVHEQIGYLASNGEEELGRGEGRRPVIVDWLSWQRMLNVQRQLAEYLHRLSDPDEG